MQNVAYAALPSTPRSPANGETLENIGRRPTSQTATHSPDATADSYLDSAARYVPVISRTVTVVGLAGLAGIAVYRMSQAVHREQPALCPPGFDIFAHASVDLVEKCFDAMRGAGPQIEDCSVPPEQHCIPSDVWGCVVGAVCGIGRNLAAGTMPAVLVGGRRLLG